ncbi:hypothetical protein A3K63_01940 [Candidatus Micrarchaeota archaeon RBG_16_49_10]|nr:MAG: hypothetical protein A3K63_01940 [Candidatus Micrarchaeota archaeon RBG_16_49_10]
MSLKQQIPAIYELRNPTNPLLTRLQGVWVVQYARDPKGYVANVEFIIRSGVSIEHIADSGTFILESHNDRGNLQKHLGLYLCENPPSPSLEMLEMYTPDGVASVFGRTDLFFRLLLDVMSELGYPTKPVSYRNYMKSPR